MLTTEGGLLQGRLRYRQPAQGFRSGIEPVFLAASIPALPGQHVLEAGTGAGAALLCLHARIPDVESTGVERDPDLAGLAANNAAENGFSRMRIVTGDILATALAASFDHVMTNPPYHAAGPASPVAARERAKRGSVPLLRAWIARLAASVRPRGTMTVVVPSGAVPTCVEAMAESGCACTVVFPLWPRQGNDAKLVLVRGVRGSRAPMRLAAGLTLHEADGRFTDAAQAVLRGGSPLLL